MGDSIVESIKENRVAEIVEKILGASSKQTSKRKTSKARTVNRVENEK
jgi:hypothetical protein